MLELGVSDKRPTQKFWKNFDKEKFLKETIEKHKEYADNASGPCG